MTGGPSLARKAGCSGIPVDPAAILNALAEPIFLVDEADAIAYANPAAEQFFQTGLNALRGRGVDRVLSPDSPILALISQVRAGGHSLSEYGITIHTPKTGTHFVSVGVAGMGEGAKSIVVSIQERGMARKMGDRLAHRNAARSVTAMAEMLAHEVKNPLSGIRGAAQLLEHGGRAEDRELTRLICDEADRIVALVERLEMFAEGRPLAREAVNIHRVLKHVRALAQSGVARNARFVEIYDPSLPAVFGSRDLLIQALFNLVKNAAEAVPKEGGEIFLVTRYRHGMRLTAPGAAGRVELPLTVEVQDNGPGIPEDLRGHLFDPFVSTKVGGKGLGLALVAKIVDDHGGVIEFDREARRTIARLRLPAAPPRDGET